jgi:hypothetical protein
MNKNVIIAILAGIIVILGAFLIFTKDSAVEIESTKTITSEREDVDYSGRYLSSEGMISVEQIDANTIRIEGNAEWKGVNADKGQVHSGLLEGTVELEGNKGTYKEDFCIVELEFSDEKTLIAKDNNQCGGLNVSFTDTYKKE